LHLLLRLLESKFRRFLGRRIEHDSVKRDRLSVVIADSGNAGVKPSVLPVGAHKAIDGVISNAFCEQSIPMT
jgi:septum formation topological specificity factor MinE